MVGISPVCPYCRGVGSYNFGAGNSAAPRIGFSTTTSTNEDVRLMYLGETGKLFLSCFLSFTRILIAIAIYISCAHVVPVVSSTMT